MKRQLTTLSPILQKCPKLPSDQKLVSKLFKLGIELQEDEYSLNEIIQTTVISLPPIIPFNDKLPREFFGRHVVDVAKDLLGKTLNFGSISGIITETEAYGGLDDEASHAFKGPTHRSAIMFGAPGYSYVYTIYGMYNCLNIVADEAGKPSAVLIRGLKLYDIHLDGPGKLCKNLNITRLHNGINLIEDENFFVTIGRENVSYKSTRRIGIKKAVDKPWRFVMENV